MVATSAVESAARYAPRERERHFTCEGLGQTFTGDRGEIVALTDVNLAVNVNEYVVELAKHSTHFQRALAKLRQPSG